MALINPGGGAARLATREKASRYRAEYADVTRPAPGDRALPRPRGARRQIGPKGCWPLPAAGSITSTGAVQFDHLSALESNMILRLAGEQRQKRTGRCSARTALPSAGGPDAVPALRALHGAGHEIDAVYCQPPSRRGAVMCCAPVRCRSRLSNCACRCGRRHGCEAIRRWCGTSSHSNWTLRLWPRTG